MTRVGCLAAAQRGVGSATLATVIPAPPQAEPGIQRCVVACTLARHLRRSLDSGFALTRAPE
jgi:hypothetical protein